MAVAAEVFRNTQVDDGLAPAFIQLADRHVITRFHLDAVAVDVVLAPRRRRRAREEARVDVRGQRVGRRREGIDEAALSQGIGREVGGGQGR